MENLHNASKQVQHEIHSISNKIPTPQHKVSPRWHNVGPTLLDFLPSNDHHDDHHELTLSDDDMPHEQPTFNHYEFQKCVNVVYTGADNIFNFYQQLCNSSFQYGIISLPLKNL